MRVGALLRVGPQRWLFEILFVVAEQNSTLFFAGDSHPFSKCRLTIVGDSQLSLAGLLSI